MEKVQELEEEPYPATLLQNHLVNQSTRPQRLLHNQCQLMHTILKENSSVFRCSVADLTSTPFAQHYIDTGNAKPIKQRASRIC